MRDTADLTVTGPVLAGAVTLLAPDIAISGTITAPIFGTSPGGGTVALTATAAAGTVAMQSGTVGGQISLTVAAPAGLSVTGGTIDAPSVTLTGNTSLTVSAGTLFGETVTVGGTVGQSGGVLHARTLNKDVSFSGGDLYAGNGLGLTLPGTMLTGQAVTPGNLTVIGSGITSTATLLAGGTLAITDNGTFTQTAGTIASGAALTVAAAGVANQSGGALLSSTTPAATGGGLGGHVADRSTRRRRRPSHRAERRPRLRAVHPVRQRDRFARDADQQLRAKRADHRAHGGRGDGRAEPHVDAAGGWRHPDAGLGHRRARGPTRSSCIRRARRPSPAAACRPRR